MKASDLFNMKVAFDMAQKNELSGSKSEFLDDALKAKYELMDKEIGIFLSLGAAKVSLSANPEVSKRGTFERHPNGTEYFIWDGANVLKFIPPSMAASTLTFDCDRLYLK